MPIVRLCLDLDARRFPPGWLDRLAWCARLWRWRPEAVRCDRTARGFHVVVTAIAPERTTDLHVVAAQAILGSDPRREAFNLARVHHIALGNVPPFWRARWNVLYARHSRPKRRGSVRRGKPRE